MVGWFDTLACTHAFLRILRGEAFDSKTWCRFLLEFFFFFCAYEWFWLVVTKGA